MAPDRLTSGRLLTESITGAMAGDYERPQALQLWL
jgi:hypothetical protein